MMTEHHVNPELADAYADAYADGLAMGMWLADTYRSEDETNAWSSTWSSWNTRLTRTLIRLVLVVSLVGWLYATLEMAGIAPTPGAHAATSSTTAMLKPALTATAALRPTWDGQHPARWTGTDAMCPASSARLHRWARTGPGAPWFRVECLPDGGGQWAWNAILPKGR